MSIDYLQYVLRNRARSFESRSVVNCTIVIDFVGLLILFRSLETKDVCVTKNMVDRSLDGYFGFGLVCGPKSLWTQSLMPLSNDVSVFQTGRKSWQIWYVHWFAPFLYPFYLVILSSILFLQIVYPWRMRLLLMSQAVNDLWKFFQLWSMKLFVRWSNWLFS